jgi:hypothetical protein
MRRTLTAKVIDNSLSKSKDKGTPSVRIAFRTQFDIACPETPEILNLTADLWLTFKCLDRTFKTLKEAFGWDNAGQIEDLNEPILIGKMCNLVVEPDERDPERLKVVFINRCSTIKHAAPDEAKSIADEVRQMLGGFKPPQVDLQRSTGQDVPAQGDYPF